MTKCAASRYNYKSVPTDQSRISKLICSLTEPLSNTYLGMQPTCLVCIHLLTAKLGGSSRDKSAHPDSFSPFCLCQSSSLSEHLLQIDTHRHTTAEKPLSLLKLVTNVVLPTTVWKDTGKFCCSIDSVHLEEKHLHFPNLFRGIEVYICCIPLLVAFFLCFSWNSWLIFLYPSMLSK